MSSSSSLPFQTPDQSPSASTPLLFINTPAAPPRPDHSIISLDASAPHTTKPNRRRTCKKKWLCFLVIPARIAVGALTYLIGTAVSRRAGLEKGGVIAGGCVGILVGQVVVNMAVAKSPAQFIEDQDEDGDEMAWLDAIQAVGKIVDRFSEGLRGPGGVKHAFLDTSLLRLLHEGMAEGMVDSAGGLGGATASGIDVLVGGRYYLDYALSTYGFLLLKLLGVMDPSYNVMVEGMRGVDVARYMLRLRKEDIVVSCLDGEGIKVPRHFVAVDETKKSIVVAIRGTNSISDIITDLLCDNVPFAGGYAHGGMKEAAEALYTALLPTLRKVLLKHPTYSIALTGHSLGAGVAMLLTKLLLMNGFTDVKCYAIAPCPVFGPMHRVDSDWSDALECFVHADDLVAKLCLASARNLAMELERIDALNLSVEQKKEMIGTRDLAQLDRLLRKEKNRSLKDPTKKKNVEQLYIPSHSGVHWLIPDKDSEGKNGKSVSESRAPVAEIDGEYVGSAYIPTRAYSSFVVRPRMFERLLVTPGCLNAHFPSSYTAVFAGLGLPLHKRRLPTPTKHALGQLWYAGELG